ncbi:MAG: hypothetical protein KDN22_10955 [Verrucomicrobiae bacterium]|nr:hypothetical protein [Verrucomicrobiae bacterium]
MQLEKEKVIAELKELRRPFWKRASFWANIIAIVGLVCGWLNQEKRIEQLEEKAFLPLQSVKTTLSGIIKEVTGTAPTAKVKFGDHPGFDTAVILPEVNRVFGTQIKEQDVGEVDLEQFAVVVQRDFAKHRSSK